MALKWHQASRYEQQAARNLHTRALNAGVETSASQCLADPAAVTARIREAEQAKAAAEAEAAAKVEATATTPLTVRELVTRIGCAASTARRWLNGVNRPCTRYAAALAAAGITL